MKNYSLKALAGIMLFMTAGINAQTEDNPWQISIGMTAIDFYPVGNHEPGQELFSGDTFEDMFNVSDHWNISPSISYLSVGRYLKNNFSVNLSGTYNQIEKYGSAEVSKLDYFNLSAGVNYSFSDLLNLNKFEPTLGVGGGYSWLEEGPYNSNGTGESNAINGIGSFNTTLGITYWANDYIGLTAQSTFNYVMPEDTNVVQQHLRYSLGLSIRFGGTDTDGDGIYDKKDACPDVPGLEEFNGCPDTDGDGIQDSEDICPDTAGLAEFKGCPDTDGDGISDNNDSCPNVAGLADMGGCPDSDGDGITDKRDGCPTEAGPRGNRGCPWPDADGDSVVDKDDKCPNEAGTVANGGCPEAPSEAVQDKLASYAKTINFDYGKSSIKDEANKTLQAIVEILVQYPNANFVVEGHTDSVGSKGFNQKLSEERAASIVEFLTSNGVDAARLSSVGFGETSPVASNDTKEGMAQNRRVEVKLAN